MGKIIGEILFLQEIKNISNLELRIKEVAKELSIKMKDIAEGVDVTDSYLSRIASGNINPNSAKLQEIADFMKVPIHRLIVAPKGYTHFYNEKQQWLGMIKFDGNFVK